MTSRNLRKRGHQVEEAASGEETRQVLNNRTVDVAVVDLNMPGMSGIEWLEILKESVSIAEAVMLTGEATVQTAVEAMKLGTHDYLTKPVTIDELAVVVGKAYEAGQLRKENRQLKAIIERSRPAFDMVGDSPAMQEVLRLIERVGPTDKPILIAIHAFRNDARSA